LPSRLGDDPLARAGRGVAKPVAELDTLASPIALDSLGGAAASQPEIQSDSNAAAIALQRSHNDVFFRRREENSSPETGQIEQKIDEPVETREISEVSEIPEMREMAAAPIVGSEQDTEAVAEPSQPREAEGDAGAEGTAAIALPGTVAPVEASELVAQPPTRTEAHPAPDQEPTRLLRTVPEGFEPENSDGFFKKVFGKLGK